MDGVEIHRAKGARIINESDAPLVGRELLRMEEEEGGELLPSVLLARATDKSHALHRFFTWDDEEAANQCRLDEARKLIASVTITRIEDPRGPSVRMFVNVTRNETKPQRYINTQHALENPETRQIILNRVNLELASLRQKHSNLHELATVWDAVDQLATVA